MEIFIAIIFLILIIVTYPKWSYKQWYERCEENSKRLDFVPFSGKRS